MPRLTGDQIRAGLADLPGWTYGDGAISKEFAFDGGFMGSLGFVNRLAEAAEAADHHPDLAISWNKVTVTISTHSEGGVTEKDLALAKEAERLAG